MLAPASPFWADVVPAGRVAITRPTLSAAWHERSAGTPPSGAAAERQAIQAAWFGARPFEPPAPVAYRTPWPQLLARTYGVDGHPCPACDGVLRPVGAVLPPQAATWLERGRIVRLEPTGPPVPSTQLELPLAS